VVWAGEGVRAQTVEELCERFILVEREKDKLPQSDLDDLEKLKMLNENINTAMILTEYFHRLLDRKTVKSFNTARLRPMWTPISQPLSPRALTIR
jgi:hypothetical protein